MSLDSKTSPETDLQEREKKLVAKVGRLLARAEKESVEVVRGKLKAVRENLNALLSEIHNGDGKAILRDSRFDSLFTDITNVLNAAERQREREAGYRKQKGPVTGQFRIGYDGGTCPKK